MSAIRGETRVPQHKNGQMSELIAAHELISFDVFDTLILRKVSKPTDAFSVVKLKLIAAPEALLHQHTVDAFPELRVRAERLARADKHQRTHNHGATSTTTGPDRRLSALVLPPSTLKRTELEVSMTWFIPTRLPRRRCRAASIAPTLDMHSSALPIRSLLKGRGHESELGCTAPRESTPAASTKRTLSTT